MPKLRVMFVQPIELNPEQYEQLLSNKTKVSRLIRNFDKNKFQIDWINQFNQFRGELTNFRSMYNDNERLISTELLVKDLQQEKFYVYQKYDLSQFLDVGKSTYELVFDKRFFNFVLLLELHFDIPLESLRQILEKQVDEKGIDFYNTLRNLLVKEHNHSELSNWGNKIQKEVCDKIQSISKIQQKSNAPSLATINNNSGNITFFVDESPLNSEITKLFLTCNANAERVKGNNSTIINNDSVHYDFFSRFHTIITKDIERYYRFAPIQYHIQSTWYFLDYYSKVLNRLNTYTMSNDSKKRISEKLNIIEAYINKIELLRMNNEDFKRTIESDNEDVYQKIECKWNIENSLKHAKSYVTFFKDYLERAYSRKAEQSNRRQNQILFTISCIQILGLISIWSDYIGLNKLRSFIDNTGIYPDTTVATILQINTWLPAVLIGILFTLIILVFFKND